MRQTLLAISLLAGLIPLGAARAEGEYALQPGDAVTITITGYPELSHRAPIQVGGWLTSPLLGRVEAANLDVTALQARLRTMALSRPYARPAPDGSTVLTRINPEAITVDIAAYRPIYVSGDVARPGEQSYRPGMLVRQAVALAGGFDRIRTGMSETERTLAAIDARSELARVAATLEFNATRIARIRALIGAAPGAPSGRVAAGRGDTALAASSDAQFALTREASARERTYLETSIRQADEQIAALRDRFARENEGAEADAADFQRMQGLLRQGTVGNMRVQDARRSWQLAASQALQTASRISDVERERTRLARDLALLDTNQRLELEAQLSTALVERDSAEARIVGLRDRITELTNRPPGGARGDRRPSAIYRVLRGTGREALALRSDESAELLPGDVLEVQLDLEGRVATSVQNR